MESKRASMTDSVRALHSDLNLRLNIAIGLQIAILILLVAVHLRL